MALSYVLGETLATEKMEATGVWQDFRRAYGRWRIADSTNKETPERIYHKLYAMFSCLGRGTILATAETELRNGGRHGLWLLHPDMSRARMGTHGPILRLEHIPTGVNDLTGLRSRGGGVIHLGIADGGISPRTPDL